MLHKKCELRLVESVVYKIFAHWPGWGGNIYTKNKNNQKCQTSSKNRQTSSKKHSNFKSNSQVSSKKSQFLNKKPAFKFQGKTVKSQAKKPSNFSGISWKFQSAGILPPNNGLFRPTPSGNALCTGVRDSCWCVSICAYRVCSWHGRRKWAKLTTWSKPRRNTKRKQLLSKASLSSSLSSRVGTAASAASALVAPVISFS